VWLVIIYSVEIQYGASEGSDHNSSSLIPYARKWFALVWRLEERKEKCLENLQPLSLLLAE
jgi:hypothetical protein